MRSVHLYGRLADEFGAVINLDVSTAAEAMRGIEANFPGRFYQSLKDGEFYVVRGAGLTTGEDCLLRDFQLGLGSRDLHVVPAISGACGGDGGFQAVLGAAIIVAAVFTAGALAGPGVGLMSAMGGVSVMGVSMSGFAMFGVSMLIGGISAMLAPSMSLPGSGTREAVDPRASFVFQGAENVAAQGGPVPITYGRFIVGSTVISSSVVIEKL